MGQKKVFQVYLFFLIILTTKPINSSWVIEKKIGTLFFSEKPLSEEQLVTKFGKNGGRSYQKKFQTSRRMETVMDGCVAAVAAAVAAHQRRKQRTKNIY